jgi:hypothetical protein
MTYIDHSLYPDFEHPPDSLESIEDMADYLHRVCAAWDFHILPEPETFDLLRAWRDVFDRYPIPTSPAYHAFRAHFGWPDQPCDPALPGPTPWYIHLDRLEGRDDPCESLV